MNIYQIFTCYGETTLLITEDLNLLFKNLQSINDFDCTIQACIWNTGKEIFNTKSYDEYDYNYDNIYIELMSFIQQQNINIK